ncbi:MAG TPA: tetratricopeptide repeat protein, partial [Candidatus Wunengus sp. YC60]|uniref:tetratricopeptide repeat protein n=1 Tax=Candidatus Wunengus sp. YC60 TaxID=3367697 RepID=UPI0040298B7F
YEQGDYRGAAASYEKGLDKSMPFLNEDFVMYRLGDCYLMSERYEEAAKVFQTLNNDFINSPYHFKSRLKVGECYAGMGEFEKARKTLYTVVAQEGKCSSNDDKSIVVDAYFKIADYYMKEAQRLRKAAVVGTSSSVRSLASK